MGYHSVWVGYSGSCCGLSSRGQSTHNEQSRFQCHGLRSPTLSRCDHHKSLSSRSAAQRPRTRSISGTADEMHRDERMSGWADGSGQAFLPQLPAAARVGPADPCACHHPGRAAFFTRGSFCFSSRLVFSSNMSCRDSPANTLHYPSLLPALSTPTHSRNRLRLADPSGLHLIYSVSVTIVRRWECQRRYRSETATEGQRRPQRQNR